ncbi:EAL domain-containing protein [Robertmurraya massiliosenegalensis]|uniref:EAL domain-containing protein n=1 Tax=Robertmurraya TaxID=2837507 RepID=UPI0039A4C9D9
MGLFNIFSHTQKDNIDTSSESFSLFTDNPEAIFIVNFDGEIVSLNKALSTLLGYRMKEKVQLEQSFFQSKKSEKVRYHFHKATQGFTTTFDMKMQRKSGQEIPIKISLIPSETYIFVVCKNMSTVKAYEKKITRIEQQLEESQRLTNFGSWDYDVKSDKTHWNERLYEIFGIEKDNYEITCEKILQYVHPEDKVICCDSYNKTIEKKRNIDFEHRIVRDDGQVRVLFVHCNVILNEEGEVERGFGTIQDITELRELESKLEESEERFNSVSNRLRVGIWSHDLVANQMTFCSKGFSEVYGIDVEKVKVNPLLWKESVYEEDREEVEKNLLLLGRGEEINHQFRIIDENGQLKWIEGQIIPYLNREGNLIRVDGIVRDITEMIQHKETLAFLADHDYQTKLPNRRYYDRKLQQFIKQVNGRDEKLAVCRLDIDRFKLVNETLGYDIGDKLLVGFTDRLQSILGNETFVARIGGDEFSIIFNKIEGLEDALQMANVIIKEMEKPFYIDDYELFITTSIGISMYPVDGRDSRTLLSNANVALYNAKELGRNDWQLFSPSMNVESFKLYHLEKDLRKSLMNEELYVEYQPKVNPKTSRIEGVEALVRWNHPEWGIVAPAEFIPLAEESGFIFKLGDWVMQEVCETLGKWVKQDLPVVPVSVNVSPKRLLKSDFVHTVQKMIFTAGIDPSLIELELTEQTIIRNMEATKQIISELKAFGVKVALDDFGTGYSSLSYLKDLNIDTLKIDKSFIDGITLKKENDAIVKSLIYLCREIDINVVTEGVETKEQLNFLLQQECQQIQGYIYSRPVSEKKLKVLLKKEYIKPLQKRASAEAIENKRKFYRIRLNTPLTADMTIVKFKNKEVKLGSSKAIIEDLSLGGLKYISNINLPVQKDMVIQITTRVLGREVKLIGTNVWKLEENDLYNYGFEFILNEVDRDRLAPLFNKMVLQLKESAILPDSSILQENKVTYLKG